jgi:hypothetical protein
MARFHSTDDPRMPAKFICFDCRLKADIVSWTMIKEGLYPRIMEKYRDFVTFRYVLLSSSFHVASDGLHSWCRRAIKVAENSKAITPVDFARSFGMTFG